MSGVMEMGSDAIARSAPRVSVIVPVYNRAEVISQTIDAVLAQTFTDFELLLCDDGSTDDSVAIIKSYSDPRIRLLENGVNKGSDVTRNRLIAEARGEFCAMLDSDDMPYDYRLRFQVDFLDSHPDVDVLSGALVLLKDDPFDVSTRWHEEAAGHERIKVWTLFRCAVANTTLMFRREKLIDAGIKYYPGISDDVGFYKEAVHKLRFETVDIPLVRYRVWEGQESNRKDAQVAKSVEYLKYQYDLLGVDLTEEDRAVLGIIVAGGAFSPDQIPVFRRLSLKIVKANARKRIFDSEELCDYILSKIHGMLRWYKQTGDMGNYKRHKPAYTWLKLRLNLFYR